MWDRLQIRKAEETTDVVNRHTRATEIQPPLIRRITGTATGNVGGAIGAEIPSLQGAPASTNGNDEFDVAVGAGGKAWVAFRENFTYGAVTKARALVRTFDGTTFGTAQVIDSAG